MKAEFTVNNYSEYKNVLTICENIKRNLEDLKIYREVEISKYRVGKALIAEFDGNRDMREIKSSLYQLEGYPVMKWMHETCIEILTSIISKARCDWNNIDCNTEIWGMKPKMETLYFSLCDAQIEVDGIVVLEKDGKIRVYPKKDEKIYSDTSWVFDVGEGYRTELVYGMMELSKSVNSKTN